MKTWYVIPARKASKGFPNKNRILMDYALSSLEGVDKDSIILTTDDSYLYNKYSTIRRRLRPAPLAKDAAPIKPVIEDVIKWAAMDIDDIVVVLYATYPERTSSDISRGLEFLNSYGYKSVLCRKKLKVSPHLILKSRDEHQGDYILDTFYYQRQNVPEYFELSHFLCIIKVSEMNNLNAQLFNSDTGWMWIGEPIDIDRAEDLDNFYMKNNKRTL